eukprot:CAMPEP_0119522922 /NCGR_PEP_ID=MMETSP1344-20130328/38057_1 /TAXON_ID=236787 /ORGANISM="Florenciella parvula, Strain CCMP2471" /LENGTH=345 /DNA_ID=CAMNT_0007560987 /DNA_START=247 /DNA_END=1284 /DNA_ORIENTATION=-
MASRIKARAVLSVLALALPSIRGCGSYVSLVLSNCSYARVTAPNGKLEGLWPLPADACPGDSALSSIDFGDGTEKGLGAYFFYTGSDSTSIWQVAMDKSDHADIDSEVSVRATWDSSYTLATIVQPRTGGSLFAIASLPPGNDSSVLLEAVAATRTTTTPELSPMANLTSLALSSSQDDLIVTSDATADDVDAIFVVDTSSNMMHTITIGVDETTTTSTVLPDDLHDKVAHVEFLNDKVGMLVLTTEPRQLLLLDKAGALTTPITADLPPLNSTRPESHQPQLATLALASTFYYEDRGQLVSVLFPDQDTYQSASVLNPTEFGTIHDEAETDLVQMTTGNLGFQL